MNDYTIIEDIFGEEYNQTTAARGYIGNSHLPSDMKKKKEQLKEYSPEQRSSERMPYLNRGVMDDRYQNPSQPKPKSNEYMEPFVLPSNIPPSQQSSPDSIQCRDIFVHVENCPICSSYFKKDIKFYWFIIAILILIIAFLSKNIKF